MGLIYNILLMGNTQCCDVSGAEEEHNENIVTIHLQKKPQSIDHLPMDSTNPNQSKNIKVEGSILNHPLENNLSYDVKAVLEKYKDLEEKTSNNQYSKQFGAQFYKGQLDSEGQFPSGYGKIYKTNGSVYLGQWKAGKAHGKGVYVLKDGSYYDGEFRNNKAEGIGKFYSKTFNYEGHFVDNKFQGKGSEKSDHHTFQGQYFEGCKERGILKWRDNDFEYEYHGKFNFKNEFEGKGILKDPKGVYKGEFLKGEKHGKGTYEYQNGLKYEGDYVHDKKEGKGTLFNHGGSISYSGQFQDDLPHGQGLVIDKEGKKQMKRWVKGIDSDMIIE